MLVHNVAALLQSPPGASRDVLIDEIAGMFGEELDTLGPVTGTARLLRTSEGVLAKGTLRAIAALECSRCLEPVAYAIDVAFSEEFLPTLSIATGLPLPPPEDDALGINEHHVLDLRETARQYLVTELPMSTVCSETCLGLCPNCGANRNLQPCACAADTNANPFALLARLARELQPEPFQTEGARDPVES